MKTKKHISFIEQAERNHDALLCLRDNMGEDDFDKEFSAYEDEFISMEMHQAHLHAVSFSIQTMPAPKNKMSKDFLLTNKDVLRQMEHKPPKGSKLLFFPHRLKSNIHYLNIIQTYALHCLLSVREKSGESLLGFDKDDFDLNKISIGAYSPEEHSMLEADMKTVDTAFTLEALKKLRAMTRLCAKPYKRNYLDKHVYN